MPWWLWLAVGVAVLVAADRLLLIAEGRRWINYRRTPSRRGTAGHAALAIQQIFEPETTHVLEQQAEDDAMIERESTGEPPASEEQP